MPASRLERDFLISHCSISGCFSPFGFLAGVSLSVLLSPHPVLSHACALCFLDGPPPLLPLPFLFILQGQRMAASGTRRVLSAPAGGLTTAFFVSFISLAICSLNSFRTTFFFFSFVCVFLFLSLLSPQHLK